MRIPSIRPSFHSWAAFGVALLWGAIELFALQRSRVGERFRALG